MSYLVSLHSGLGSMSEAMQAGFEIHVATKNDAKAVERAIYSTIYYKRYGDDCLVIVRKLKEPLTGDAAVEALLSDETIAETAFDYADDCSKEEFELFPEVTEKMIAELMEDGAW